MSLRLIKKQEVNAMKDENSEDRETEKKRLNAQQAELT